MALLAKAMSVVEPLATEQEVEGLSDEQIEQLLQQATVRLREQQAIKLESRYTPAIPAASKLMVPTLAKPYVQTTGDIAKADTSRLVDEQHRQLADGAIRKVEDPVLVKQKNLEVSRCGSRTLRILRSWRSRLSSGVRFVAGRLYQEAPAVAFLVYMAETCQLVGLEEPIGEHSAT